MKTNKKKIKKYIITAVIMLAIIMFFNLMFIITEGSDGYQIMNNLDYNITLNDDGSMRVVETWDIYINYTNTIFKNFDKSYKYGDIKDVQVKDLTTGEELKQIDTEMYHVDTGCFYALDISSSKFEIAWGTGLEKSQGNKKYQISYTIEDVATQYKDCEEFYWKLLSSENAIQVKKVTGTVTFPREVENIENLKAWGHGPLNGNIYIASKDTVKFDVDDLAVGKMLEIRVVTTENLLNNISSKKNKRIFIFSENYN